MKHTAKSSMSKYFAILILTLIFTMTTGLLVAEAVEPIKQLPVQKPLSTASPASSVFKISPAVLQKTSTALGPLVNPFAELDTSYKKGKETWASYESAYFALKSKLAQCSDPNKAYTKADQEKAGCLPGTTTEDCSRMLIAACIEIESSTAMFQWFNVEKALRDLEKIAYKIGCKQQQEMALIPLNLLLAMQLTFGDNYCKPVTFP